MEKYKVIVMASRKELDEMEINNQINTGDVLVVEGTTKNEFDSKSYFKDVQTGQLIYQRKVKIIEEID